MILGYNKNCRHLYNCQFYGNGVDMWYLQLTFCNCCESTFQHLDKHVNNYVLYFDPSFDHTNDLIKLYQTFAWRFISLRDLLCN